MAVLIALIAIGVLVAIVVKMLWTPTVDSLAALAKLKPGSKVKVRGKISGQGLQASGNMEIKAVEQFRGKWVPLEQTRSRLLLELTDGAVSIENDTYEIAAKSPPTTSSSLQNTWSNGHHTASLEIYSQGKRQVATWDSGTGQGTRRHVEIAVGDPILAVGTVTTSPGGSALTATKVESQRPWRWED